MYIFGGYILYILVYTYNIIAQVQRPKKLGQICVFIGDCMPHKLFVDIVLSAEYDENVYTVEVTTETKDGRYHSETTMILDSFSEALNVLKRVEKLHRDMNPDNEIRVMIGV